MILKIIAKNLLLLSLVAVSFLLSSCDKAAERDSAESAASEFTIASNQKFSESLDLDHQQDFEDATRGLVASAPADIITNSHGQKVWDASAYDFIQGDAPDTVNPSLWRQAKLNNIRGLFEVDEGIYQLRGFDLANTTLIKGQSGWIVVDPLTTLETTKSAMAFAEQHLGEINLSAVIFTHSHIDHFGGVLSLIDAQQAAENNIPIIAPSGFMHEAVSENIVAGPAMMRRGAYMMGNALDRSATGHVDTGLGKQVIFGSTSILQPTLVIDQPQVDLTIDGVDFEFYNMPNSEAPAELTFYLPQRKAFCGAEILSHVMHNVLTLRGAKVRDALLWSDYIGQSIDRLDDVELFFNSHHWPTWGHERIITQMQQQQDMYKFIHDQTVRLANIGYTPREIAERLKLPKTLAGNFHIRGYYGTLSHNSKAVYQHYFGWYDGNPAHLNPLPPEQSSLRYVEFMGGAEALLEKAAAYQAKGEYRWVGEVLNHLVFAEPDNIAAREMLAEAYRQMAYQAESGPWRDIYLSAALELIRGSVEVNNVAMSSKAFLEQVPLKEFMKALTVKLDAEKAEGVQLKVNLLFSDSNTNFVLTVRNSVMYFKQLPADSSADVTLSLTQKLFVEILLGETGIKSLISDDELSVDGSVLKLIKFFSLLGAAQDDFNIVLP
ncbi:MAG: alkyl sulfatase dimerization domain-containing protein [Porticoccaceae bacterium]|nr:alkyl sulfatase dimerization domain-containing protein [Porticoccaceae bacterium]